MAMVAAAIANDGKLMEPYLVQTVRSADSIGDQPTPHQRAVGGHELGNAKQLADMMVNVVDPGHRHAGEDRRKRVGGKTGTACSGSFEEAVRVVRGLRRQPTWPSPSSSKRRCRPHRRGRGRLAGSIAKDVIEALS